MPDDDLTPEEEQVRRMLADARHTEPMPDDVADRLDEVLAGLQESHHDDPVVRPLRTPPSAAEAAAAHRRQRVRNWLVAAAAVVVVGVGVNQIDWNGMGGDDEAASSGSDSVPAAEAGGGDAAADQPAPNDANLRDGYHWRAPRAQLTAARYGVQVERLRDSDSAAYQFETTEAEGSLADGDALDYSPVCDFAKPGRGHLVPVRYDGERAWLVFRAPEGDSQVVDLYLCGQEEPSRSITLPVP